MSVIEFKIYDSTLLFMGHFKIYQKTQQIKLKLEKTFDRVFVDWSTNWEEIYDVLIMFGNNGVIKNFAASKFYGVDVPTDPTVGGQSDLSKTQYSQKIDVGTLVKVSKLFKEKGLLKDNDFELSWGLTGTNDIVNLEKWKAVCQSFQQLQKDLEELFYICLTVTTLRGSNSYLHRSPVQLDFYKSALMKTTLTTNPERFSNDRTYSVLHRVPISSTTYAFNVDGFLTTLYGDYWYNLIGLTLDTEWIFGETENTYRVLSPITELSLPSNTVHLESLCCYNNFETSACSGFDLEDLDADVASYECSNVLFVASDNIDYETAKVNLPSSAQSRVGSDGLIKYRVKTITIDS